MDDLGEVTDPRSLFAKRLRALRSEVRLSVRQLEVKSGTTPRRRRQPPVRLARGTIAGMLSETAPVCPEQDNFEVFVDTCLRVAEESGHILPGDLGSRHAWDEAYANLLRYMSQLRSDTRQAAFADSRILAATSGAVIDWDPLALGIHPSIDGSPLPQYVRRDFDQELRERLDPQASTCRLVVIRGGSSTGKSRAAYEAILDRLATWKILYPRSATALSEVLDKGPPRQTVLWLSELKHYAESEVGQEVLARLHGLLSQRRSVVIITTLWPEYWKLMATEPQQGRPDRYLQARLLLEPYKNQFIDVPKCFTDAELDRARHLAAGNSDSPLNRAIIAAESAGTPGEITQLLAGARELVEHYEGSGADPYGQALLEVAMDASRLGHPGPYSADFLRAAAPGYLGNEERAVDPARWFDHALDYATRPLRGSVRALKPVAPDQSTGTEGYSLADYLDQHGQQTRRWARVPAVMWNTLAGQTTDPEILFAIGIEAESRGLYRYAAELYFRAARLGRHEIAASSLTTLVTKLGRLGEFYRPMWSQAQVIYALAEVMSECLEAIGFDSLGEIWKQIGVDLAQSAGSPDEMQAIAEHFEKAGRGELTKRWQEAASVEKGNALAMGMMAGSLDAMGRRTAASRLWQRAEDMMDRGDRKDDWKMVAGMMMAAGRIRQADKWWRRAEIATVNDGSVSDLAGIAAWLQDIPGLGGEALRLFRTAEAADQSKVAAKKAIAKALRRTRVQEDVSKWRRSAEIGDSFAIMKIAGSLQDDGQNEEADKWTDAATTGSPYVLMDLAEALEEAGVHKEAELWWLRAAEAGMEMALTILVWSLESTEQSERSLHLRKFGIEPGGSVAQAWELPFTQDRPNGGAAV